MDQTARNVWRGLAGMFILDDPFEASLPLPTGEYDVPLMITDRTIAADGSMPYVFNPRGVVGNTILVNGRPQPYMEVADRRYRLRLLNASNTRQYEFMLSTGEQLVQVATESGLLPRRVDRQRIRMGPGERVEIVLDFAGRLGQDLVLRNMLDNGALTDVMQFRVRRDVDGNTPAVPQQLRPEPVHPAPVQTRTWNFGQTNDPDGSARWVINGLSYDHNRIDARPRLGTTERWVLRNTSNQDHLVHLHDVDWRMVTRNGRTPPAHEAGLKETFRIAANEEVVLHTTFTDHLGVYIFHCHVLEHEDKAMMLQFEVVP
jgi:spore coat protein A